jgi:DNA-binding XRE family transcriptional regulator
MSTRKLLRKVNHQYHNRLRECRLKALVAKQEDLAKMTGISRSTISALENNRLFLSSQYALRIAEVLHCTLDNLYERKDQDDLNRQHKTTGMLNDDRSS